MSQYKLSYRAEIDGLRAIAVISVIFYHAQMVLFGMDWFDGGYIGVDVFFVISGYLITRIILSELQENGSFSFLNFYERRARRILPMLFVVILASIPYAWQKFLPSDLMEYAESILASLFFGSNFFFYFRTTEYGADSALLKPLLHTWSLGVEEQFYLAFPVLAIIAFKFFRKHFLAIFVTLSLLSILFAELMEARNSGLNFYLPFSRFWELTVGSALAYRELNHKTVNNGFKDQALPMVGLCLVVYSVLFFDGKTPHPSFYTIAPILGVALIIGFASKDELVGKVLGSKPFVWVGLISYSAYLWHFPIFAFSRLEKKYHTNYEKLEWVLLTLILSVTTYFLIERPSRRSVGTKSLLAIFIACIFSIVIGAIYIIYSKGVPTVDRLGFNVDLLGTVNRPSIYFDKNGNDSCGGSKVVINNLEWCQLGNTKRKEIDFLLLGDSHSRSATTTLDRIALKKGQRGLYFGTNACLPLLGAYVNRGKSHPNKQSENCQKHTTEALQIAKEHNVKHLILIARWDYYVDGSDSGDWQPITDGSFKPLNKAEARILYDTAVDRTYNEYEKTATKLVVLLQVPHQKVYPRRIFEKLLTKSNAQRENFLKSAEEKFLTISEHNARQKIANKSWLRVLSSSDSKKVVVLDPTEVFCRGLECAIYDSETSFYFDDDHPSTNGFARLGGIFSKALSN